MKTIIIISMLGLMTLGSCTQRTEDVSELLNNPETRSEIFEAIVSDHNQMMSFMETMQNNQHAMQMMQGNHGMMGNMMKGNGMHMMMKDSMMMHTMMQNMMMNKKMMGNMMRMMNNRGMMSNDCMQATINSMNGMEMMRQEGDDSM